MKVINYYIKQIIFFTLLFLTSFPSAFAEVYIVAIDNDNSTVTGCQLTINVHDTNTRQTLQGLEYQLITETDATQKNSILKEEIQVCESGTWQEESVKTYNLGQKIITNNQITYDTTVQKAHGTESFVYFLSSTTSQLNAVDILEARSAIPTLNRNSPQNTATIPSSTSKSFLLLIFLCLTIALLFISRRHKKN